MIAFNWADYFILIILSLSVVISLVRGFVREALSLATWISAFWISFHFLDSTKLLLSQYIHTPSMQTGAAFLFVFIIVLLIGNIGAFFLSKIIAVTGLGGTDRILGSVFGLCRGILLLAIILLLASTTPFAKDSWWEKSVLIPQFKSIQLWLKDMLPDSIKSQILTQ